MKKKTIIKLITYLISICCLYLSIVSILNYQVRHITYENNFDVALGVEKQNPILVAVMTINMIIGIGLFYIYCWIYYKTIKKQR